MINVNRMILDIGTRRSGEKIKLSGLTIHSTGNENSTALNERKWLDNPNNTRTDVAWTYCIDEKECIQAAEDNDLVWHAQGGSKHTFGIEICESGNREVTLNRAAKFVAQKLKQYNWDISNVYTHSNWYPSKICPRILSYNNWQGLSEFKKMVQKELDILNKPKDEPIQEWKIKSLDNLKSKGIVFDYDLWKKELNNDMPVWAFYAMTERVLSNKLQEKYHYCKNPSNNYKFNVIHNLAENGIDIDVEQWRRDVDKLMPVWAVFIILDKCLKILKGDSYKKQISPSGEWRLSGLENVILNGIMVDYDLWRTQVNEAIPVWATFSLLDRL